MNKRGIVMALAGAVLLGAAFAGCGGGGGGSAAGTSTTPVLVTDSFREDFGHVWATIYHVDIVPSSGSPVQLFDDPAGHQIDLRTLRDATGQRFAFLANATIPAGTYTAVKITIGPTLQLFRAGVAVGNPIPVDSSIPVDANKNPVLTLTFKSPKTLTTSVNPPLVIDFDLAHFILRASGVLPAVQEGDGSSAGDPERHNADEYHGTVSAVSGTSPDLTFTLAYGGGQTVTVVTSASTALYGDGTLANGAMVEVTGTLDTATGNLVATRIEVAGTDQTPPAKQQRVVGTASAIDSTAGTFTVTLVRAGGFTPSKTTVNVVTNTSTVFRADGGGTLVAGDFFTTLASTPGVMVQGTYDATSNTLTATAAGVIDPTKDGGWEHSHHDYRPGVNHSNWGHGVFH